MHLIPNEEAAVLLLSDNRLMDVMRDFVVSSNRIQHLSRQDHLDLHALGEAESRQREAAKALQEALLERGWRKPMV
jgi:hypothetical protein